MLNSKNIAFNILKNNHNNNFSLPDCTQILAYFTVKNFAGRKENRLKTLKNRIELPF